MFRDLNMACEGSCVDVPEAWLQEAQSFFSGAHSAPRNMGELHGTRREVATNSEQP